GVAGPGGPGGRRTPRAPAGAGVARGRWPPLARDRHHPGPHAACDLVGLGHARGRALARVPRPHLPLRAGRLRAGVRPGTPPGAPGAVRSRPAVAPLGVHRRSGSPAADTPAPDIWRACAPRPSEVLGEVLLQAGLELLDLGEH